MSGWLIEAFADANIRLVTVGIVLYKPQRENVENGDSFDSSASGCFSTIGHAA